ncbi:Pol, partial [Symbiodinium pilosum]
PKTVGHGSVASWKKYLAAMGHGSLWKSRSPGLLLELLIAVKLWVRDSEDRQSSRVALRGFTDNQSNEALVKKAMTTKYPSSLILLELTAELAAKKCDLSLTWIRREVR